MFKCHLNQVGDRIEEEVQQGAADVHGLLLPMSMKKYLLPGTCVI
jgi:hypothetical protein